MKNFHFFAHFKNEFFQNSILYTKCVMIGGIKLLLKFIKKCIFSILAEKNGQKK